MEAASLWFKDPEAYEGFLKMALAIKAKLSTNHRGEYMGPEVRALYGTPHPKGGVWDEARVRAFYRRQYDKWGAILDGLPASK